MFCPNCGYNYEDENSNFCPNCGAPLNQRPVWQDNNDSFSNWNQSPSLFFSVRRKKLGCLITIIFFANLIIFAAILGMAGTFSSESTSSSSFSEQVFSSMPEDTISSENDSIPTEYKSALTQAESYAEYMHMSKAGIYDQLVSEYGGQFSEEAARYAVNHIDVDWKANALATAENYQTNLAMSPKAIYDQLVSEYGEKFTPEEAQYAIDHLS